MKDGSSAVLHASGYKDAFAAVSHALGDPETFHFDWKKEEILTEADPPQWFPMREGWKWFNLASTRPKPTTSIAPVKPHPTAINWNMWSVVVGVVAIIVTLWLAGKL